MEVARCKEVTFEKSFLIAQEVWLVRPASEKWPCTSRISTRGLVGKEYKSIRLNQAKQKKESALRPSRHSSPTLCKPPHCLAETKDR